MTRVATGWLVYRLTHSAFLLGLVSFAGQIPILLLGSIAGVWVDRLNRHRVLVVTQIRIEQHDPTNDFRRPNARASDELLCNGLSGRGTVWQPDRRRLCRSHRGATDPDDWSKRMHFGSGAVSLAASRTAENRAADLCEMGILPEIASGINAASVLQEPPEEDSFRRRPCPWPPQS